jgi:hypothetical protein
MKLLQEDNVGGKERMLRKTQIVLSDLSKKYLWNLYRTRSSQ